MEETNNMRTIGYGDYLYSMKDNAILYVWGVSVCDWKLCLKKISMKQFIDFDGFLPEGDKLEIYENEIPAHYKLLGNYNYSCGMNQTYGEFEKMRTRQSKIKKNIVEMIKTIEVDEAQVS